MSHTCPTLFINVPKMYLKYEKLPWTKFTTTSAQFKLHSSNQTTQLESSYTARTKPHSSNQSTQPESNYTARIKPHRSNQTTQLESNYTVRIKLHSSHDYNKHIRHQYIQHACFNNISEGDSINKGRKRTNYVTLLLLHHYCTFKTSWRRIHWGTIRK